MNLLETAQSFMHIAGSDPLGALLFVSVIALAGAVGTWIGSYYRRSGELKATKAGFADIKEQLTETTKLTEDIKSAVGFHDWHMRESLALRLKKIEELYELLVQLNRQTFDWWVRAVEGGVKSCEALELDLRRIDMLVTLYFPSLYPVSLIYGGSSAYFWQQGCVFAIRKIAAGQDISLLEALHIETRQFFDEFHTQLQDALTDFQQAIVEQMSPLLANFPGLQEDQGEMRERIASVARQTMQRPPSSPDSAGSGLSHPTA